MPGPPIALFAACCLAVATTTALLNLDTAAVFLTPVLILAARRRSIDQAPFLYGALFMVNASSLYLPGSNLTNLLVTGRSTSGAAFFARMLPAALTATVLTALGVAILHRSRLFSRSLVSSRSSSAAADAAPAFRGATADQSPLRVGVGLVSVIGAAACILVLRNAALPVLAIGLLAVSIQALEGRLSLADVAARLGAPVLLGLFALAVALGTIARATGFPGSTIASAPAPLTAAVAALSSVLVNNLPAAVLLSAAPPAHPTALLLGLDIGPNLAVTGSLSALLWWRAARLAGARPSARSFSRQGLLLAPLTIAVALAISSAVG